MCRTDYWSKSLCNNDVICVTINSHYVIMM